MTTKIEKVGAGQQVIRLREEGQSWNEIRDYLRSSYPNELSNISHMAPKRYIEKMKEKQAYDKILDGEDPGKEVQEKFLSELSDMIVRMKRFNDDYEDKIQEALDDGDIETVYKMDKRRQKNNEQLRKDLIALRQWHSREMKPTYKAKTINITQVNNMLLSFARKLCPKCRSKVFDMLEENDITR